MERMARAKEWLGSTWLPAVLVLASPAADGACVEGTGLHFAELLRPFGVLRQLNGGVGVPVRTSAEQPLRLHSWTLRFYAASTMFQPPQEAADAHLKRVLTAAAADAGSGEVPEVQDLIGAEDAADPTPWYRAYRDELLRMLSFGEHETFDHPVACLLVLPADHPGDLAAAFKELWTPAALPPLMQQGAMEPRVLRHYVLLHDAGRMGAATLQAAQERARQLSSVLGSNCHVVTVNSGSRAGSPPVDPRQWTDMLQAPLPGGGAGEAAERPPTPPGGVGAALTQGDMDALAAFVHELAVRSIIPHLEARVSTTRKGLRNQLKSLLWRKSTTSSSAGSTTLGSLLDGGASASGNGGASSGAGSTTGGGPAGGYHYSSLESQMRQLADLALMLGDCETAATTLRLLATDYKSDRTYKHYAGVQEALGACAALAPGGSPTDAVACLKEAFYRYNQLAQSGARGREGTRYATRAAMVLAVYLRAVGQAADANWILMKAHFQEDNMSAGLLLEQAAHCLLAQSPPHLRKFAFHLVLAGLRYNMCEQKGLALRAYRQVVLGVYSGRRWGLIEEHLHDVLGKQSQEGGDAEGAARHFAAMLLCPHNSASCQRAYMAQFLEALQGEQASPPVLELPVPVVGLERVGLQYDSQACYANVEARQVAPEAWRPLEAALQPQAEGAPATWLDGGSRLNLGDPAMAHTCCVGEPVGVDVELRNPLQLELALTNLRLACSFEPAASISGGGESSGDGGSEAAAAAGNSSSVGFQVREESITLRPDERVICHLRVVPLRPGKLTLDGVAWTLGGSAQGQQRFRIPHPRPRKPGTNMVLIDAERPPPGGVSFTVLPPMPRLEVSLEGLEPTLLAGQLVRCRLRLRNTGAMTLQNLSMATGSRDVFLEGSSSSSSSSSNAGPGGSAAHTAQAGEQSAPGAAPSASASGAAADVAVGVQQRQGLAVFSLPQSLRLGVGQDVELPIWLRPARPGPVLFNMAWCYEPFVRVNSLRFHTLRSSYSTVALPALHLSLAAVAGTSEPGRCLLQLHALNPQSREALRLTRLSCPGGRWLLSSLPEQQPADLIALDTHEGQQQQPVQAATQPLELTVGPEAAATLHYRLAPAAAKAAAPAAKPAALSAAEAFLFEQGRLAALPPQQQQQQPSQKQQRRQQQQQQQGVGGPPGGSPQQGELAQPVDVLLQWEAPAGPGGAVRRGFAAMYHQRVRTRAPIHMQLVGPESCSHDFSASAFCVVPLTLRLRNTLATPAAVCVEVGQLPDGQPAPTAVATWASAAAAPASSTAVQSSGASASSPRAGVSGDTAPARAYMWCGATRLSLPLVPGNTSVEVPLHVAALVPGSLSLSDYNVSWSYAELSQLAGRKQGPPCFLTVHPQQPL